MPIADMTFELHSWPLDQVLTIGVGDRGGRDAHERRTNPGDWLRAYMDEHRTWPSGIIVLDNEPPFSPDLHRYQLLEGHRRLGYLRVFTDRGIGAASHAIWLARTR
jgi:hypothetical protein